MAKFSILVLLAMMTLPAKANCSVADALIKKYGISFSGFEVDLPRIFAPRLEGSRAEDLVVIRSVNKKGFVPDGFSHSALIDVSEKKRGFGESGDFSVLTNGTDLSSWLKLN